MYLRTISKLAKSQDIELSIAIFVKCNLSLQYYHYMAYNSN